MTTDGREIANANKLATELESYSKNGALSEQANQLLSQPEYKDPEVRRLAIARLEKDGCLPSMLVSEFANQDGMNKFGHTQGVDPPFGWAGDWHNASPFGEAQYFGQKDFGDLANGTNDKFQGKPPDEIAKFLAGAMADRYADIQGIAQRDMYSQMNTVGSIGHLWTDTNDKGITMTDLKVWAGKMGEGFSAAQQEHFATIAGKRASVENAIYFALDPNSNIPVLKDFAAGTKPINYNDLGAVVNDTRTMNSLPEMQRDALNFLYQNFATITGDNSTPLTKGALDNYATIMGTDKGQAQRDVSDLLALNASDSTVIPGSSLNIDKATATQAINLTIDSRLAPLIKYDGGTPHINRSDLDVLLSASSKVLNDSEKNILGAIPLTGVGVNLDQLASAAGYDSYAVLTGNQPISKSDLQELPNQVAANLGLINNLSGGTDFITQAALRKEFENDNKLTSSQKALITELLSSYKALSAANPDKGISVKAITAGDLTVSPTNTATNGGSGDNTQPPASTGRTVDWTTHHSLYDVANANLKANLKAGQTIQAKDNWVEVANVLDRAFESRVNQPDFKLPAGRTAADVEKCIAWLRSQYADGKMTGLPKTLHSGDPASPWTIDTMDLLNNVMVGTTPA